MRASRSHCRRAWRHPASPGQVPRTRSSGCAAHPRIAADVPQFQRVRHHPHGHLAVGELSLDSGDPRRAVTAQRGDRLVRPHLKAPAYLRCELRRILDDVVPRGHQMVLLHPESGTTYSTVRLPPARSRGISAARRTGGRTGTRRPASTERPRLCPEPYRANRANRPRERRLSVIPESLVSHTTRSFRDHHEGTGAPARAREGRAARLRGSPPCPAASASRRRAQAPPWWRP
jgi:hypothetical protein